MLFLPALSSCGYERIHMNVLQDGEQHFPEDAVSAPMSAPQFGCYHPTAIMIWDGTKIHQRQSAPCTCFQSREEEWWVGMILNRPHLQSSCVMLLGSKGWETKAAIGKKASSGKDSPYKREDLSLNPSLYVKSQRWWWTLAIPMQRRRRPEDSWCSLASQSNQTGKPQHAVKDTVSKTEGT